MLQQRQNPLHGRGASVGKFLTRRAGILSVLVALCAAALALSGCSSAPAVEEEEQEQEPWQVVLQTSYDELVVFDGAIPADGFDVLLMQGGGEGESEGETRGVDLADCTILIDGEAAALTEEGMLQQEGLAPGEHELEIAWSPAEGEEDGLDPEAVQPATATIEVTGPYGGADDAEVLAWANEHVAEMYDYVNLMASGSFVENDWASMTTIDGWTYVRVAETDSVAAIEDMWYQHFSDRYTIEETIQSDFIYVEQDGALWVAQVGVGWEMMEYEISAVERLSRDEVLVSGTRWMAGFPEFSEPVSFTLVYEDGTWKFGCVEEGTFISVDLEARADGQGSGSTGGTGSGSDDSSSGTSSWTSDDYLQYMRERLIAAGQITEASGLAIDRETADTVTAYAYDSAPGKISVTGWYQLDKNDLTVTDMTFGNTI